MKKPQLFIKLSILSLLIFSICSAYAYSNNFKLIVNNNTNGPVYLYVTTAGNIQIQGSGNNWLNCGGSYSTPTCNNLLPATGNPIPAYTSQTFNLFATGGPNDYPWMFLRFDSERGKTIGTYQFIGHIFSGAGGTTLHCNNDPTNHLDNQVVQNYPQIYPATLDYHSDRASDCQNSPDNVNMTAVITVAPTTINYKVDLHNKFTENVALSRGAFYPANNATNPPSGEPIATLNKGADAPYTFTFTGLQNTGATCKDANGKPCVIYHPQDQNGQPVQALGCEVIYDRTPDGACTATTKSMGDKITCVAKMLNSQGITAHDVCEADVAFRENPPTQSVLTVQYQKADGTQTYSTLKFASAEHQENYVGGHPQVGDNINVGSTSPSYTYCTNGLQPNMLDCKPNTETSYSASQASHKVVYQLDDSGNIQCVFNYNWKFSTGSDTCLATATPVVSGGAARGISCSVISAKHVGDKCVYAFAAKETAQIPTTYQGTLSNNVNVNGQDVALKYITSQLPANTTQTPAPSSVTTINAGDKYQFVYDFSKLQAVKNTAGEKYSTAADACQTAAANGQACIAYGTSQTDACVFTYYYDKQAGQCVLNGQAIGNNLYCLPAQAKTSPVNSVCVGNMEVTATPQVPPKGASISVTNNTFDQLVTETNGMPSPIVQGVKTAAVSTSIGDGYSNRQTIVYKMSSIPNASCTYEYYYSKDGNGQDKNPCVVTAKPSAQSEVDLKCSATAALTTVNSLPVCSINLNIGLQ